MIPVFITRLRERQQQRREVADLAELAYLRRENARLMNDVTHYINENNRLWNAIAKLPGGLDIARKRA